MSEERDYGGAVIGRFDNATHIETQEKTPVTDQENPAVSKLREAFDTARNALIEGSELAKQVENLRFQVISLKESVDSLTGDLQYVRNRNKELDEQVTQVRRSRDEAMADASEQRSRAEKAEADLRFADEAITQADMRNSGLRVALDDVERERDDAMTMALEYEGKFKEAQAKLAKIEAVFDNAFGVTTQEAPKPVPHYEVQPRDEVGKFQPMTYPQGSQSRSEDPQS